MGSNSSKNLYDVNILAKSLQDLNGPEGWKVINPIALENLKDSNKARIVTVGKHNVGKTLVLLEILNHDRSLLAPTNGIGLIINGEKKSNFIGIDIKGYSSTCNSVDSKDFKCNEFLLQDIAIGLADILIVVVGDLGNDEKEFLDQIKENTTARYVVIIHNFICVTTNDEYTKRIKETFTDKIEAQKVENDKCEYYKSKYGVHFPIANENAFSDRNRKTFQFIRHLLEPFEHYKTRPFYVEDIFSCMNYAIVKYCKSQDFKFTFHVDTQSIKCESKIEFHELVPQSYQMEVTKTSNVKYCDIKGVINVQVTCPGFSSPSDFYIKSDNKENSTLYISNNGRCEIKLFRDNCDLNNYINNNNNSDDDKDQEDQDPNCRLDAFIKFKKQILIDDSNSRETIKDVSYRQGVFSFTVVAEKPQKGYHLCE